MAVEAFFAIKAKKIEPFLTHPRLHPQNANVGQQEMLAEPAWVLALDTTVRARTFFILGLPITWVPISWPTFEPLLLAPKAAPTARYPVSAGPFVHRGVLVKLAH